MLIRRVGCFFKTQLDLDRPNFFNSATNRLFSPLQSLIGQKKYQSLHGKVSEIPETGDQPAPYSDTTRKAVWVFALIAAAFGTVTRGLSFLSSHVNQAYKDAFLLQVTDGEMIALSCAELERSVALREEKEKERLLNDYLVEGAQSLNALLEILENPENQIVKLAEYYSNPRYSFPFLFAKHAQDNQGIECLARRDLWEDFMRLHQSCLQKLSESQLPSDDQQFQQKLEREAVETIREAFLENALLFNELLTLTRDSTKDAVYIVEWLEEKKGSADYSYPFYTQLLLIPAMEEWAKNNRKLDKMSEWERVFTECKSRLEQKDLQFYTEEKPPENFKSPLTEAIARWDGIAKVKKMIQKLNPPT